MSGALKSAGGFLGVSGGPQAPGGNFDNNGLDALNDQNRGVQSLQGNSLMDYANRSGDTTGAINAIGAQGLTSNEQQGLANQLATGATTGSNYATQQVQNNPLLSQGLNAQMDQLHTGQGLESGQTGILNNLQSQGFNLTPGDQSLYGQEAGQIANQYAQQGNQAANSLASRGLSSSGAAGAQFSGIAGNQNQQLAQAQQQIAQQRFSNTQNQIAQQQNFIGALNGQNNSQANAYSGQAANDINQQYGRQLSGANQSTSNLSTAAGLQSGANNAQNQYGMDASKFNAANTPANFMDFYSAGLGSSAQEVGAGSGQLAASQTGASAGKSGGKSGGLFGASGAGA